jgi:hypothetical protein
VVDAAAAVDDEDVVENNVEVAVDHRHGWRYLPTRLWPPSGGSPGKTSIFFGTKKYKFFRSMLKTWTQTKRAKYI